MFLEHQISILEWFLKDHVINIYLFTSALPLAIVLFVIFENMRICAFNSLFVDYYNSYSQISINLNRPWSILNYFLGGRGLQRYF